MPIYTTYLANKPKFQAQKLGSCFVYFVMRNRGNDEVAPTSRKLKELTVLKDWQAYEQRYLLGIRHYWDARVWMEKRASEAKIGNILLVCYERDPAHCHRRLLAEEMARRFGVEYKGEL